jgi:hypothetical protein
MGLQGYRLWVMGQLDSTCRAPPLALFRDAERFDRDFLINNGAFVA